MNIGIIILAAGASTRMGTPKQLLGYQKGTLLSHTIEVAIASVCRPIIVVLGAYAERIEPTINHYPIEIVYNPDWSAGMGTSIQVGIQKFKDISEKPEAAVLVVGDQPFVSSQLVNCLVESYCQTGKSIIASEYANTVGIPALFSSKYFADLLSLKGTKGAKKLLLERGEEVARVSFPEGEIDIDIPDEYQWLQSWQAEAKNRVSRYDVAL